MRSTGRNNMKKILDYTIMREKIRILDEDELCQLLMYTDRDRRELEEAEKLYWWCIEEINRRIDCGEISEYCN